MDWIFMKSPQGEVREVEATPEQLTPLMVAGWHQVPPPAATGPTAAATQEDKQHGQH
jgi:hypothetical protein